MDWALASVSLANGSLPDGPTSTVQARLSEEVMELFIPSSLATSLNLEIAGPARRINHRHSGEGRNPWPCEAQPVGPVALKGWGRTTWCCAFVHGDEVVLGWQPRLALLHDEYPTVFSHVPDLDPGVRRDDGGRGR